MQGQATHGNVALGEADCEFLHWMYGGTASAVAAVSLTVGGMIDWVDHSMTCNRESSRSSDLVNRAD